MNQRSPAPEGVGDDMIGGFPEQSMPEVAAVACETAMGPSSPFSLQQSQDAMNGDCQRRTVIVADPLGLHMRPLTAFAQRAGQFQSTVTVIKEGQKVNGKSPLELMLLAAEQGTELVLEVSGPDALAAIDILAELLAAAAPDDSAEPPLPKKG